MTVPETGGATRIGGKSRSRLVLLAMAQFLIALDYSIVYVALPSIGADFALSESAIQWVISGYAVFFAGFLIVGGRAADRFGARTLFIGGLVLFGVASLAGGLAAHPWLLLVARAAQGIAAAALQPAVIKLINTSFAAGPQRNRALAVWGTVGASGLAAGVIIGGLLSTASWRWVFLINLPLALVGALTARSLLPNTTARTTRPLNVPSAVLVTAAMLAAALGLTWAASEGWGDVTTVGAIGAAVVLMAGFLLHDRRSPSPLVERALRRTATLVIGCGATALYMASVGNEFFVVTLLLQQDRGYGPLAAGLAFLPLAVMITVGNTVAGRIVGPLGVRRTLTLAFTVDAVGLLLLALQIGGDGYVLHLLPGLLVSGLGHGITYTAMFIAGTQDLHDDDQGIGSALMTTSQYLAGALGVAVLVLVLGHAPGETEFGWAFVTTAAAAALGAALAWIGLRRSAPAALPSVPATTGADPGA
ncbi:MFS transporter [Actinophytocola sp.]|uniref:MFS transporter n=1 Tax=Actinophytocola sp. TaxID=1872138 RepID=UPI002D30472A|nr:MFS transporter [Actinophytocola sp.]HYQ62146.1 MFS transporter [Actinophytocola sp.]